MQRKSLGNRIFDQQGLNHSQEFAKEKSRKKLRNYLRFLVLFFFVVILITVGFQIPPLLNKLQKPFPFIQSKLSYYSNLDLTHRINILLVTENSKKLKEIGFLSLENGDHKIRLFKIDPETKVHTENFSGTLSQFAFQEKMNLNIDNLELVLASNLGYFFDGYIINTDTTSFVNETSLEKLIDSFYSFGFLLNLSQNLDYVNKKIKTNLTLNQANTLIWFSKGLLPKRVDYIDLSASKNNDGSFNSEAIANKIGLVLADSAISKEGSVLEIVNASETPGIGTVFKNIVVNLGATVLDVSKASAVQEKSSILIKDKESSLSKRLETIFATKAQRLKKGENFEADVKLIIGKDYASLFNF